MAQRERRPTVRVDSDGVRTESEPGVRIGIWLLVGAAAVAAIALLMLRRPATEVRVETASATRRESSGDRAPAARAPGSEAAERAPRPPVRAGARPVPRPAPTVAAAPADATTADEVADEAAQIGEQPSGIALFPPPGTDPPKPGIIVPEDFELPPGYVRHYQATDDGQRLPAILMFHPDFEWVDEDGQPLAIPEDHVVPPDLAPPGLPIEILQVPETKIELIEEPPGS